MTRSALGATTRQALADLDPARSASLTPGQQVRADRRLEAILAHEPRGEAHPEAGLRRPHVRRPFVLAAVAVVAVIVVVAGLAGVLRQRASHVYVPASPPSTPAPVPTPTQYETWTAVPVPASPTARDEVEQACRNTLHEGQVEMNDPPESGAPKAARMLERSTVVVAERRGGWTYVVLATDDGFTARCLFGDSSVPGFHAEDGFVTMESDLGYGAVPEPPAADGMRAFGTGGSTTGSTSGGTSGFLSTTGLVGEDVRRVVVNLADGRSVAATVANGWFVAWWPFSGDAYSTDFTYTLLFRDGSASPPLPYAEVSFNEKSGR